MSCDSVRRNLKAIPMEAGAEWIWNANLRLVEALLGQDYILDMDQTGYSNCFIWLTVA